MDERNSYLEEIPRIRQWIETNDYTRIALQFPQNGLDVASDVVLRLETVLGIGRQFFILADTSYRSCCLDEITAEHASCDSIIHFGDSCLSQSSQKIPSLHVFGKSRVDFDDLKEQIGQMLRANLCGIERILLLYDSSYASHGDELSAAAQAILPPGIAFHNCKIVQQSQSNEQQRIALHRSMPSPHPTNDHNSKDVIVFIAARHSPLLALFLLTNSTKFATAKVLHYIPEENCTSFTEISANKMLMKRLYLVEKVRDARTIGLVIGSASLDGCREAITRIRSLCQNANKKLYVFYIGKMNEAKLTNFGTDVDVFVMLSCPYGILLEEKKFFKPVVSMIELEMALNQGDVYANAEWTAEFQNLLANDIQLLEEEVQGISLASGTVRSVGKCNAPDKNGQQQQLVEYSAGDYFNQRTWKGLEDCGGGSEGKPGELKKGRFGIASHYDEEPQNNNNNLDNNK